MSYKPIISKIRCHNPNLKSSKHANRANLHYIATREGVDLSYVTENQEEDRIYHQSADEEYTRYMAKRPKSHGLFGNIATDDLKAVEQLVYHTAKSGTNIYRGIISLGEQDALELGYTDSNSWYQKLSSMMPDIAHELGISPTNHTWIGAFHAEPSHPHVHYQIWDNTAKVKSSFLHVSAQKKCRAVIEKAMFPDEYERSLQAVFESEREELYGLKNASREEITNYFKDVMNMVHVPGIRHEDLPSRLSKGESEKLAKQLGKLQEILPTAGRMNYKFMPPEVKKELDKVSDILFQQPDMKVALSRYLKTSNQIHQIKALGYDKRSNDNAKKEIYRRTGNIVLKNMTTYLNQFSSYEKCHEEQLEKQFAETTIISAHSSLSDEAAVVNDSFLMDEGVFNIDPDFSPEAHRDYIMGWNLNYKAALSLLYDAKDTSSALPLLNDEAASGNALAYADLGKIYYYGIGVDADPDAAEEYYKHAFLGFSQIDQKTSKPNAYCKYRLGKLYESGFGTQQDLDKARLYYSAAASEGKSYAQYSLGKLYLSHMQKFSEILEVDSETILQFAEENLKASADQGFPYGAYEYAKLNDSNPEISTHYYKTAYIGFQQMLNDRRDDKLLYRLGNMTLNGKGVEKDIVKAIKYFEEAAKLNNVYAKLSLAKIYLNDQHPEYQDIDKAFSLLTSSAEQGNQFAQYSLGKLYLGNDFPEYQDINKAISLLTSSAEQGNQFAQYSLGKLYLGNDFPECQDIDKAFSLLTSSAEQGNQFAQYSLGKLYLGNDFPEYQDIDKAFSLLTSSAEQGNQFAQYSLGKLYLGNDFPEYQDINKAISLLTSSAEQGNQFAQLKLGTIYLYGKYSMEKNEELGKSYLQESVAQGNSYAKECLENYELHHSPLYIMSYFVYKAVFSAMMTGNHKQWQRLNDLSWDLSLQARKEKKKAAEITNF